MVHGIRGTVTYFDAKNVPCEKLRAVRGEVVLENGEFMLVDFVAPSAGGASGKPTGRGTKS
jgi:hypothetical protein